MLLVSGCEPARPVSSTYRPRPAKPTPAQAKKPTNRIVLPTVASISREPMVRVRIAKGQPRADIASSSGLLAGPSDIAINTSDRRYPSAVAVTLSRGSFLITDTHRRTIRWALPALRLSPVSTGRLITYDGQAYPGTIVLVPAKDRHGAPTGKIDVINHVGMESYLPGVVERELYGSWEPATFRAAVIAARSYALFEQSVNAHRHYDLESTTASQAYAGQARNPKATAAVAQTRGMLLEFNGRVVPAFYSSACGGLGQDANAAFTWLPGLPAIQPLSARNHGGYCSKSTKYRWGPVRQGKSALAQRIRAWGERTGHPIKSLRGIRGIRVAQTNAVGRPSAFTIDDHAGLRYTLGPEQFRMACNSSAPGLAAAGKGQKLFSSHVQVTVGTSTVTFHDGRGFGHGVGLCQFGAQALAQAGHNEFAILAFYYPGARVVQSYR